MPSQVNMKEGDDLFRATLEWDHQPITWVNNPNNRSGPRIKVNDGPAVKKHSIIGPYTSLAPIKSYVTRHRSYKTNLKIVKVEKVAAWEEVDF